MSGRWVKHISRLHLDQQRRSRGVAIVFVSFASHCVTRAMISGLAGMKLGLRGDQMYGNEEAGPRDDRSRSLPGGKPYSRNRQAIAKTKRQAGGRVSSAGYERARGARCGFVPALVTGQSRANTSCKRGSRSCK